MKMHLNMFRGDIKHDSCRRMFRTVPFSANPTTSAPASGVRRTFRSLMVMALPEAISAGLVTRGMATAVSAGIS